MAHSRRRVPKAESMGVQGEASAAGTPVEVIPNEGKASFRKVDTHLVCTPCFQPCLHE